MSALANPRLDRPSTSVKLYVNGYLLVSRTKVTTAFPTPTGGGGALLRSMAAFSQITKLLVPVYSIAFMQAQAHDYNEKDYRPGADRSAQFSDHCLSG